MQALDHALFLWLNLSAAAPAPWVRVAQLVSLQLPHWLVAATLAVALLGRPQWRMQAWRALAAMALAAVAVSLLKRGFNDPRPAALGLGTQWLPDSPGRSFPSAHACVAMAWAATAAATPLHGPARWPLRALLLGVAALMGWSRIAVGVHFPFDVLAGWGLGAACAWAVLRVPCPAASAWRHWLQRWRD